MTDETPARSMARAHLSQLIDMFGMDGCLRVSTDSASDTGDSTPGRASGGDEPQGDDQT
ncbi:hypothetical protein ACFWN1_07660 [Streptomyces sp. NPDC058459]|uniref:hypothetical protein n=1 Tax=Streptomyces sp. NPDC058459 TaxID=3346508 RepID=UPI0036551617